MSFFRCLFRLKTFAELFLNALFLKTRYIQYFSLMAVDHLTENVTWLICKFAIKDGSILSRIE